MIPSRHPCVNAQKGGVGGDVASKSLYIFTHDYTLSRQARPWFWLCFFRSLLSTNLLHNASHCFSVPFPQKDFYLLLPICYNDGGEAFSYILLHAYKTFAFIFFIFSFLLLILCLLLWIAKFFLFCRYPTTPFSLLALNDLFFPCSSRATQMDHWVPGYVWNVFCMLCAVLFSLPLFIPNVLSHMLRLVFLFVYSNTWNNVIKCWNSKQNETQFLHQRGNSWIYESLTERNLCTIICKKKFQRKNGPIDHWPELKGFCLGSGGHLHLPQWHLTI